MNIEIKYFELDNGKQPFKEWLDDLDKVTKSILLKRLDRVTLGNFGDCKPLINTDSLWELKIDYGPGYRIYFGRKGNKIIILLVGGEKKAKIETSQRPKNTGKLLRRKSIVAKLKDYQELLLEQLKDPELALLYLKEALADEDERLFFIAVKNVAKAQGIKITDLASKTNLNRENLYRIFSNKGNPQWNSIKPILEVLGYNLTLEPAKK